ncbi:glycosyltransferase [Kineococcus rubinsiae]|uniref:glycosyltransferase n=1 Tax=Kineococcus rubinsiae TaxID=2609562 RepID=UPI0014300282|nr:glycosyltransferase [Kineococcus rubinsiae]NIZ91096.1 glycosyltransferase [Kineococcus rubinsiae]
MGAADTQVLDAPVVDPGALGSATVSVVVPAHDEARTLAGTLQALAGAVGTEVADVVVVANGCTDATADVARAAGARVVELTEPSKAAALSAGDHAALAFPRVYLDADIRLTPGTLDALAATLRREGVLVASPRVVFDTSRSSWPVRAFYAAYRELPYVRDGLVGLGVYGMSEAGRARFGDFPRVTSDDLFVQRLFSPGERAVSDGEFVVAAPRDLRNLLKVRTRTARGNAELGGAEVLDLCTATHDTDGAGGRTDPTGPGESADGGERRFGRTTTTTTTALLRLALVRPRLIPSFAVYTAVTIASRVSARRRQSTAWQRDTSTR